MNFLAQKWTKDMKRQLATEEIQMAAKTPPPLTTAQTTTARCHHLLSVPCVSGTGLRAFPTLLQKMPRRVQLFTFCNGESPI